MCWSAGPMPNVLRCRATCDRCRAPNVRVFCCCRTKHCNQSRPTIGSFVVAQQRRLYPTIQLLCRTSETRSNMCCVVRFRPHQRAAGIEEYAEWVRKSASDIVQFLFLFRFSFYTFFFLSFFFFSFVFCLMPTVFPSSLSPPCCCFCCCYFRLLLWFVSFG